MKTASLLPPRPPAGDGLPSVRRVARVLAFLALGANLPATALAGVIVVGTGTTWKPMPAASTGTGSGGSWDSRSYDSRSNQTAVGTGLCSAGSLVLGEACDWVERSPLVNPMPASGGKPLEFLSEDGSGVANAGDFFFRGTTTLDLTMLFQLTNWDGARLDAVGITGDIEFGWYRAGDPSSRTAIFGPGGPFSPNTGVVGETSTVTLSGDFGFYYRNTMFRDGLAGEVLFFTESQFNDIGLYQRYYAFADFENQARFGMVLAALDDELLLIVDRVLAASGAQQFVLFREGDRYWLGLEDQVGTRTNHFCPDLRDQPCSDYDFNDLLVGFDARPVPEPATLSLLAAGLFAAARMRRRR